MVAERTVGVSDEVLKVGRLLAALRTTVRSYRFSTFWATPTSFVSCKGVGDGDLFPSCCCLDFTDNAFRHVNL